jgi:hypothetical protein
MATVNSGEMLFPVFVELLREPKNEMEVEEINELIRFEFTGYSTEIEKIEWSKGSITINFRLADWDDFDQEALEEYMDRLTEELNEWEEK